MILATLLRRGFLTKVIFGFAALFIVTGSMILIRGASEEIKSSGIVAKFANYIEDTNLVATAGTASQTQSTLPPIHGDQETVTFERTIIPTPTVSDFNIIPKDRLRVAEYTIFIHHYNSNRNIQIHYNETSGFVVNVTDLQPGEYKIFAKGRVLPFFDRFYTHGPSFYIGEIVDTSEDDTVELPTPNNPTLPEVEQEPRSVEEKPIRNIIRSDDRTLEEKLANLPVLTMSLPNGGQYSGTEFIDILTFSSKPIGKLEIYSLKSNNRKQFLGNARRVDEQNWQYKIDTSSLVPGKHVIFARSNFDGALVTSNEVSFEVKDENVATGMQNSLSHTDKATPFDTTESGSTKIQDEIFIPKEVENSSFTDKSSETVQKISPVTRKSNTTPVSARPLKKVTLPEETEVDIRQVFKDNEKKIAEFASRYAFVVRTYGTAVETSKADIGDEIMSLILKDKRLSNATVLVLGKIRTEIDDVLDRTEKLELKMIALKVADENEQLEILERLAEMEVPEDSMMDVTSPKEFGLVREDLLSVNSVDAVDSLPDESASSLTFAKISGRAVPGSLVTLYIYSTPIMVTVKTSNDGTFEYLFEKELEDGEHEVYVALTNTEGAVIAKSNAFRFVKQAEAFSVTDEASGDILVPATTTNSGTNYLYIVVFALSFIGVGLVLLVLGMHSRKREGEILSDYIVTT